MIGAGRQERAEARTTYRNDYRDRALDTRLGTLNPRVPKLRQGSYFPGFLEPRRTSEKALVAFIQEAWIGGVSTRRVDDLVKRWGSVASRRFENYVLDLVERLPDLARVITVLLATRRQLRDALNELHGKVLDITKRDAVCLRLMTVPGVGPVTSLAFASTIDIPARFRSSRAVLGLSQSSIGPEKATASGACPYVATE